MTNEFWELQLYIKANQNLELFLLLGMINSRSVEKIQEKKKSPKISPKIQKDLGWFKKQKKSNLLKPEANSSQGEMTASRSKMILSEP